MPPRLPNGDEPQDPPVQNNGWSQAGDLWTRTGGALRNTFDPLRAILNGAPTPRPLFALEKLPSQISHKDLNRQFQDAVGYTGRHGNEIDYTIKRGAGDREFLTTRNVGTHDSVDAGMVTDASAYGDWHDHGITEKNGKSTPGGAHSGQDLGQLINSPSAAFAIVQAGPRQYMAVKTQQTPRGVDTAQLNRDVEQRSWAIHGSLPTMSWIDASEQAAKEFAAKYNLGFYEGRDGIFNRVHLPSPMKVK